MIDEPPVAGTPSDSFGTPGLSRRMACFVYEGVLLFGVLMISGYLYSTLTQQRHALSGRHGLQAFVFVVLAIYFTWFWSHGGQTVAMKAWRIRLLTSTGDAVTPARALLRYLLSWIWFAPALAMAAVMRVSSAGAAFGTLVTGVAVYAGLACLQPKRQFWHDRVCGTQLVTVRPATAPALRK